MFCPKCGIENPESGKFCRKCGTGLSEVSKALKNQSSEGAGADSHSDLSHAADLGGTHHLSGRGRKRGNNPDDLYASGVRNTIFGFGFLVISMVLFFTGVAGGHSWWWAMLFPGFSMIAGGFGNIAKAKRLEKRMSGNTNYQSHDEIPGTRANAVLPPAQTDYISPSSPGYKTGDLVPSSVVENTTRHLELDNEGETMTLPKDKV